MWILTSVSLLVKHAGLRSSDDVLCRIGAFITGELVRAKVIKVMIWYWCKGYRDQTGETRVENPYMAPQFWEEGVPMLTRYDKIDSRVLDYCIGSKTTLEVKDALVVFYIGASGNRDLIEWTRARFAGTSGLELAMYIGAVEMNDVQTMELLAQAAVGQVLFQQHLLYLASKPVNVVTMSKGFSIQSSWYNEIFRGVSTQGAWFHEDYGQRFSHPGNCSEAAQVALRIASIECSSHKIANSDWIEHVHNAQAVRLTWINSISATFDWILQFERMSRRCVLIDDDADYAAICGSLLLTRWCYARGLKCTNKAFDVAALLGNLDVLQFLYAKGVHGSSSALVNAVLRGHFDVVVWLYEKNLVDSIEFATNLATRLRRDQIARFLQEPDPRQDIVTEDGVASAELNLLARLPNEDDRASALDWIIEYEEMCTLARQRDKAFKQELAKVKESLADEAACHGLRQLLMWAYVKGYRCTQKGYDGAAERGHTEVLHLLRAYDN